MFLVCHMICDSAIKVIVALWVRAPTHRHHSSKFDVYRFYETEAITFLSRDTT